MRTFDYRNLPSKLFDGRIGTANVHLYEDKGRFEALQATHADVLEGLRAQAHQDNVDASMRIEGLYIERARLAELLDGAAPANETEAQAVGYSNALRLIENEGSSLELSTATILAFYEALFAHRNLGSKSRYRKKDFMYVDVNGQPQAVPVSPINAFETPLVLGGACDSLAEAFSADTCSPLILGAVFTIDFLCIRPFDEGNGRIARLLANLLLMKAGFDIASFCSVDRLIEQSGMAYYDALNACVEGWDRSSNDYAPYATYWLETLHAAYQQLFGLLDASANAAGGKSLRVRRFIQNAGKPIAKRDIRNALPGISEATIENELGKLVREGFIEKLGAGRATSYRWLP